MLQSPSSAINRIHIPAFFAVRVWEIIGPGSTIVVTNRDTSPETKSEFSNRHRSKRSSSGKYSPDRPLLHPRVTNVSMLGRSTSSARLMSSATKSTRSKT